jgi:hypothetical protein
LDGFPFRSEDFGYVCKNHYMEELIMQFMEYGLTREQAEQTIHVVNQWLILYYPVAGVLAEAWSRKVHTQSTTPVEFTPLSFS